MGDRKFTLKDFERIKRDIFGDFFDQQSAEFNQKELMKAGLEIGSDGEVPPGYHRMPETGEIMRDSEMIEQ